MQASPLLMYVAALDHGSKKYTTYELMISCCPIGSDPVCCLYLSRTGTDPCLFITPPWPAATNAGRWRTTGTAERREPGRNLGHHRQGSSGLCHRIVACSVSGRPGTPRRATDCRLAQDPQHAQAAFKRLLQSPDGRRLQAELVKAQQDVADAWSLGVEKIPAVVVDRQYVVYGEPDVSRALELIAKARRSR